MPETHPIIQLWSTHHPTSGYPVGVEAVPQPIPGLAFFPGGWGLFGAERDAPLPPMPTGGIMVLGHDFHSRRGRATRPWFTAADDVAVRVLIGYIDLLILAS